MNTSGSADEKEWLKLLQAGSERAFDCLYKTYSYRIYSSILRMVKDPDTAQEILQDVFLKIWENRERIDLELSFQSFLYKIARHQVYNYFRRENIDAKAKNYIASMTTELHNSVEEAMDYEQTKELLDQAVADLPQQRRLVFTMCKIEGRTYKEVSQALNISESTINDHIVKATRILKEKTRYMGCLGILIFTCFYLS